MSSRVAQLIVIAVLLAVLGGPALAAVLEALEPARDSGSGLMAPVPVDAAGGVRRPLGLAVETLRLVFATEAIALPIGLPLAFLLFRTDLPGRKLLIGLLAVLAFVPMPLHASAWLGAIGNAGRAQAFGLPLPVLSSWTGAAFIHAMAALAWIVVLAGIGLATVESELEESASLDRPAWWVAIFVTLRRSLGAIACGMLAVAVLTAGDMTVTDLLQVRTYAEEAYLQYNLGNGPAAAGAVALPPLVVLGALVVVGMRWLLEADPARLPSARRPLIWGLGRSRWAVAALAIALLVGFVAAPLSGLVWRAGRVGGLAAAGRPPSWSLSGLLGTLRFAWDEAREPLLTSMALAAVGATVAAALAWALAWLSRKPGPWRVVTAFAAALALAAPGPVAGMALVFAYRSIPVVYDSAAMVVLAAVSRTFPYALLVVWPAIRALPPEYLDAATVDGLGPSAIVRRIAVPLTRGAIVASWGVAFVLALGELPATNLVTPPGLTPISVVIWSLLHTGVESHLAGVVLVDLAAVALTGSVAALAVGLAILGSRRVSR